MKGRNVLPYTAIMLMTDKKNDYDDDVDDDDNDDGDVDVDDHEHAWKPFVHGKIMARYDRIW